LRAHYAEGTTDEFLKPIICTDAAGEPLARIVPGDVVLSFNFRTDRPREITRVLTQEDKPDHGMHRLDLRYLTMTNYDETFRGVTVLFAKEDLSKVLGEVLAEAGKTQVRIAETEKYAHVTFFFSGGREAVFPGERRILIPSPKEVATYDEKPEMSAYAVTDAIVRDIEANQPDFICLNYANTDMVGHTGIFAAAVRATEAVDECLGRLIETARRFDYECIIIADHGNSDYMINEDGSPNTAHTTNLVPCLYVGSRKETLHPGKLGDIAPTLLHLMEIAAPPQMTGDVLLTPAE
jgi:2,3-bisphosphoglycerate-independent phosphoglycerate mutase